MKVKPHEFTRVSGLVSDNADERIPVDAVYLYFQKAFDKVSYSKLLTKVATGLLLLLLLLLLCWFNVQGFTRRGDSDARKRNDRLFVRGREQFSF